jgi:hypothetical protein
MHTVTIAAGVFAPGHLGELTQYLPFGATVARRLLSLLRPGMLVLLDRAFDANAFLGQVAAAGALLVARAKSTRHPPVLGHLPDGWYLSRLDGLAVRVIEASVTVTGAGGSRIGDSYRLITTLMDHRRFPAAAFPVDIQPAYDGPRDLPQAPRADARAPCELPTRSILTRV